MMAEIDNALPGDVVPMPTVTITLEVITPEVEDLLLKGCDAAEALYESAGEEPDAYFKKVRDRLREREPSTPKITIPKVLMTDEVKALIAAEIAGIEEKHKREKTEPHWHLKQTKERLGLDEDDHGSDR